MLRISAARSMIRSVFVPLILIRTISSWSRSSLCQHPNSVLVIPPVNLCPQNKIISNENAGTKSLYTGTNLQEERNEIKREVLLLRLASVQLLCYFRGIIDYVIDFEL